MAGGPKIALKMRARLQKDQALISELELSVPIPGLPPEMVEKVEIELINNGQ